MSAEAVVVDRVAHIQRLVEESPGLRDNVLMAYPILGLPHKLRRGEDVVLIDRGALGWFETALLVLTTQRILAISDHILRWREKVIEIPLSEVAGATAGVSGGAGYVRIEMKRRRWLRKAREAVNFSTPERARAFSDKLNETVQALAIQA